MRVTAWLRGLDAEGLGRVCRLRADVCDNPPPRAVEDLARRLSAEGSVARAVARLDRDALLVAQSMAVLGDGTSVARLRGFVRDPPAVLDATLGRLRDRALVWPGEEPDTLRLSAALHRHWAHPLDLGTPVAVLADAMTKEPLRDAASRLGTKLGSTRDAAARNVCAALSDPGVIGRQAAKASPEAQALLTELAHHPRRLNPSRSRWEPDSYRPAPVTPPSSSTTSA